MTNLVIVFLMSAQHGRTVVTVYVGCQECLPIPDISLS